jgi:hypothetical protein
MMRCRISLLAIPVILCSVFFSGCTAEDEIIMTAEPTTTISSETTESTYDPFFDETLPPNFKEFASDGITLILPEEFEEVPDQQWPAYYSGYSFVTVTREPFTVHPSLPYMTLDEYCDALIASRNMDATVRVQGGLHWFDYERKIPEAKQPATYFVVVYQTSTDFWIVEFACQTQAAIRLRPFFFEWAKMVRFSENL